LRQKRSYANIRGDVLNQRPARLVTAMQHPKKITVGEMRSNDGPRRLIVCCGDFGCPYSVVTNAERWPDGVCLSDLKPKFVCGTCGHRGADILEWPNKRPWDRDGVQRRRGWGKDAGA
jgi:hypothetical protein